jgi:aspartate/methionine/tyrosine aminotransferase
MNRSLQLIPTYLSKYISDRVAGDPEIVNLSIGEPFFSPPRIVYDSLKQFINAKEDYSNIPYKYADSRGAFVLRQEISRRYAKLYNANVDPSTELLVTHGASEAIWLSILTFTSEGDEVIIPDPSYTLYETAATLLGRKAVKVPTHAADGFTLNVDEIRARISDKTKLIIINSPENPTGSIYAEEKIIALHQLAKEKGIYFVHDEVYDSFLFNRTHKNLFSYINNIDTNAVLINSFSKRYAMMGWRLGWIVSNREAINNALKIHTNLTLNLGSWHQEAAATVVNNADADAEIRSNVAQIEKNMHLLGQAILAVPGMELPTGIPEGAFFLFPNVSNLYDRIDDKYKVLKTKGEAVMEFLLSEHKVAVVPGYIYGKAGNDCVRVVAAVEEEKILKACRLLTMDAAIPV